MKDIGYNKYLYVMKTSCFVLNILYIMNRIYFIDRNVNEVPYD